MTLLDRTVAELKRREALLSDEINAWTQSASKNVNQMGIHKSQFEALKEMMDGLLAKQAQLLKELSPAQSSQQFAEGYLRLLMEIVGTHDLWRIFSYIFTQLKEERLGPLVDAADLVAADCYLTCLNQLRFWGVIKEGQFREPPLIYLEADLSPATASRGKKVQALGFPLGKYRDLRLPIPIVSLPIDYADCLWLFCTLHHEVGHNLDQDLKLGRELNQHLQEKLKAQGVSLDRQKTWSRWTNEILADVFGVLLGGAGFAYTLTSLLLVVAPQWPVLNAEEEHPDHSVRIYLVAEMLRGMVAKMLRGSGVEVLKEAADKIMQAWNAQGKPAGIESYLKEGDVVVQTCLTQPLKALANHTLKDLAPDLNGDSKKAADLAKFFGTGSGFDRPLEEVPWRLVPVAAQLCLQAYDKPNETDLKRLQELSLEYLKQLPRPEYLEVPADRSAFRRQLIKEIDFTMEDRS